jgi:hypothetical protein
MTKLTFEYVALFSLSLSFCSEVMLPYWQSYPVDTYWPPYNFDAFELGYTQAHGEMLKSGKVTITEPYMVPDP